MSTRRTQPVADESTMVLAQPADSRTLSLALRTLSDTVFQAAEENINQALADADPNAYSQIERRAMIAAEALRLTNGMDLAAILTRGDIIRQIEREGLTGVHPNGYADLTALAAQQGINLTELSNTRALCEIVFPYITEVLQQPIAEVWTSVGKSGMIEILPALRSLITGENASHTSVRNAVTRMLDEAAAALIANGDIDQDDLNAEEDSERFQGTAARVRRQAVQSLLVAGSTMTTRELRQTVRPTRTPPSAAATLQIADEGWYVVIKPEGRDQYDAIMRALGSHVNNMVLDGRGDGSYDLRRRLNSLFGG